MKPTFPIIGGNDGYEDILDLSKERAIVILRLIFRLSPFVHEDLRQFFDFRGGDHRLYIHAFIIGAHRDSAAEEGTRTHFDFQDASSFVKGNG